MERKFLKLLLRNINFHSFIKQRMTEWKNKVEARPRIAT